MDPEEKRVRQAEMRLQQLHHQVGLKHSDLQRRFVFALTLAGAVFLSLLRAEVPLETALAAGPPAAWAWQERRRIRSLAEVADSNAQLIIREAEEPPKAQPSRDEEDNEP